MKVREYLHAANATEDELAHWLGYKTVTPIRKKLDEEMPERWVRKLNALSDLGSSSEVASGSVDEESTLEREPSFTDNDLNDWIHGETRESDSDPRVESGGVEVVGPQKIKLTTIKGYVEMVYGGAETIARQRGDLIAAETIHRYTPEYSEAWIDYIRSDPRVVKWLETLMIGTPLGNLIGIHAISIGAYVLARATAKEIASQIANEGGEQAEL
jgi:hypothetical protein